MAFSGGVFTRIYNWVNDKNASINITASRMDSEMDGMATGLSTCMLKDGTQTITANIPMSTFKFTGLGSGTARTDSAALGQIQDNVVGWVAAGGTVDAITATYSPAITALVDGMLLGFRASGANTSTTPTFAPNGLTARTIVKSGGTALSAGDIPAANAEMLVRYNLANTRWELLNPAVPLSGSWTPVLTFATAGDLSVVYTTQTGSYTKIGRVVHLRAAIRTSTFTHTTASGQCNITGNPFTAAVGHFGSLGWQGITKASYTDINPVIEGAATSIQLSASGSGQSLTAVTAADMPTGGTVRLDISITFFV